MFSTLIKKKLSDNQVANIFINAIFDCVDKGFCQVAALINEDPVFVESPNISENASGEFGLIVFTTKNLDLKVCQMRQRNQKQPLLQFLVMSFLTMRCLGSGQINMI